MRKHLGQLVKFVILFGFSTASGLLKVFLISAILIPNDFGLYLGVILVAGLFSYSSSLGIFDAFLVAPRNSSEQDDLRDKIQSGLMFSSLLSISLLLIGLAVLANQNQFILLGELSIPSALFIFLQIRVNGLLCVVQGDNRPILYAATMGLKNILAVLCILAVNLDSLGSIILIEIISCLIVIILLHVILKLNLVSWLKFADTFKFIKLGVWFTANSFLNNIYNNADKYLVGYLFGSLMLGIYGFGAQLIAIAVLMNVIVSVFFLPKLVAIYTEKPDRKKLFRYVSLLTTSALVIGIIVFYTLMIVMPSIISVYLPQYGLALEYIPIICVSGILIMTNQYELYFRVRSIGSTFFGIQLSIILMSLIAFAILDYLDSDLLTFLYALALIRSLNLMLCVIFGWTDSISDTRNYSNG